MPTAKLKSGRGCGCLGVGDPTRTGDEAGLDHANTTCDCRELLGSALEFTGCLRRELGDLKGGAAVHELARTMLDDRHRGTSDDDWQDERLQPGQAALPFSEPSISVRVSTETEQHLERARHIWIARYGADHYEVAVADHNLASLYAARGEHAQGRTGLPQCPAYQDPRARLRQSISLRPAEPYRPFGNIGMRGQGLERSDGGHRR